MTSPSSTPFEEAVPLISPLAPVIAKDSLRRLISSEPLSEVTVSAEPTAAVVADVMRPLAPTVITGTAVVDP